MAQMVRTCSSGGALAARVDGQASASERIGSRSRGLDLAGALRKGGGRLVMSIDLSDCTILGGSGHGFGPGEKVNLHFMEDEVGFERIGAKQVRIHYAEILDLSIGGPGAI